MRTLKSIEIYIFHLPSPTGGINVASTCRDSEAKGTVDAPRFQDHSHNTPRPVLRTSFDQSSPPLRSPLNLPQSMAFRPSEKTPGHPTRSTVLVPRVRDICDQLTRDLYEPRAETEAPRNANRESLNPKKANKHIP